ncbi:MAG: hypothetical protein MUE90_12840 [Thermoanaerobaculales bacterium]|nr:hypothetical protein [Thermoanaerobaculales bacterium]
MVAVRRRLRGADPDGAAGGRADRRRDLDRGRHPGLPRAAGPPETVFDISCFRRDPLPFYDFTRDFLGAIDRIEPTFSHRFLAALEREGRLAAVVTQNIDSLHQKAGSRRVISVHGDYWTSRCLNCGRLFDLEHMKRAAFEAPAPHCPCGGLIKPDVVFFGEPVLGLEEAAAEVAAADLLLVLGSSLAVYPAAFLPSYATGEVVVINRGEVGLPPGPRRYFVDAELDAYLAEVAAVLRGGGSAPPLS